MSSEKEADMRAALTEILEDDDHYFTADWTPELAVESAVDALLKYIQGAAPYTLAATKKLIQDLTDPDECSFDHHGGCQAHGYLSLQPGETCPQADAKEWA